MTTTKHHKSALLPLGGFMPCCRNASPADLDAYRGNADFLGIHPPVDCTEIPASNGPVPPGFSTVLNVRRVRGFDTRRVPDNPKKGCYCVVGDAREREFEGVLLARYYVFSTC